MGILHCTLATRDVRRTLENVRELLAPAGLLVLLETVASARWADVVFGLTPGWWSFTDHDLRAIYEYLSAIPCIEGPPAPSVLHNDCT